MLALTFIILSLNKMAIRPIKKVSEVLKNLSNKGGDLSQQIEIMATDEIGELSGEFNNFINTLKNMIVRVKKNNRSI